uniref:Rubicon like autophagy enhancer n=1 Tax=Sphaeramia orbicularis TaxID=375764 RepID=A0A673CLY4_9TELE
TIHTSTIHTSINSTSMYSTSMYSTSINSTSMYSTSMDSTSMYSTSMDSTSINSTSMYSTSMDSTSMYSTSIYSTSMYSTSMDSTSIYSTSMDSTSIYSTSMYSTSIYSTSMCSIFSVLTLKPENFPGNSPCTLMVLVLVLVLQLPGTGGVVCTGSLTEEIRQRTRMRGTLSWTPPRFQIICSVQPTHRRSAVVALQQFLCAGCGTEVEPSEYHDLYVHGFLYFCDCCHSGSEAVIPGRVLSCWDFSRHPVSDFSKQLLDSVWHQPLFDLTCVGKTLYNQVKELNRFRDLREQLLFIKKLLKACRLSEGVYKQFERLPVHLTEQPHLFSMDDLLKVKKGQLVAQARALVQSTVQHVQNCELCLARGFICEFCRERDIIFPFQSDICKRCPVCKACFHKHCFMEKKCPKCARIQTRRKRTDGPVK